MVAFIEQVSTHGYGRVVKVVEEEVLARGEFGSVSSVISYGKLLVAAVAHDVGYGVGGKHNAVVDAAAQIACKCGSHAESLSCGRERKLAERSLSVGLIEISHGGVAVFVGSHGDVHVEGYGHGIVGTQLRNVGTVIR